MSACACCGLRRAAQHGCADCAEKLRFCSRLCYDYYHGKYVGKQAALVEQFMREGLGRVTAETHAAVTATLLGADVDLLEKLPELSHVVEILLGTGDPFNTWLALVESNRSLSGTYRGYALNWTFVLKMLDGMVERGMIGRAAYRTIRDFLGFINVTNKSTPLAVKLRSPTFHLLFDGSFDRVIADDDMMARFPHLLRWRLYRYGRNNAPPLYMRRILYLKMLFDQHQFLSRPPGAMLDHDVWIHRHNLAGEETLSLRDWRYEAGDFQALMSWDYYPNVRAPVAFFDAGLMESSLRGNATPSESYKRTAFVEYWTINDPVFFRWSWGPSETALARISSVNALDWEALGNDEAFAAPPRPRLARSQRTSRIERFDRLLDEIFFADDIDAFDRILSASETEHQADALGDMQEALSRFSIVFSASARQLSSHAWKYKSTFLYDAPLLIARVHPRKSRFLERLLGSWMRGVVLDAHGFVDTTRTGNLMHFDIEPDGVWATRNLVVHFQRNQPSAYPALLRHESPVFMDALGPRGYYDMARTAVQLGNIEMARSVIEWTLNTHFYWALPPTQSFAPRDSAGYVASIASGDKKTRVDQVLSGFTSVRFYRVSEERRALFVAEMAAMTNAWRLYMILDDIQEDTPAILTYAAARSSLAKLRVYLRETLVFILESYRPAPETDYERMVLKEFRINDMYADLLDDESFKDL